MIEQPCAECAGEGMLGDFACYECNGKGSVVITEIKRKRHSEAVHARDVSMAVVTKHADPMWMSLAEVTLYRYLETHDEFFVDDFWTETQLRKPREARALGPIVKAAASKGWMVDSGRSRPSVASKMGKKPIWISQIYKGETIEQRSFGN